jgi:hypothetical protein
VVARSGRLVGKIPSGIVTYGMKAFGCDGQVPQL